uniref:Photolyase/cryptochrome alpha/beta domain-containing protein n=1 Tax=Sinocyclocheilus anshuiensis TaxID=1608454 RepID=A0A671P8C8_9TELE
MSHNSIHWFRKGLRLHDNPTLLAALEDCRHIYPLFLLDPWYPNNTRIANNRWRFLIEALRDLDYSLKKLNSRKYSPGFSNRIIDKNNCNVVKAIGPPKKPVLAPTKEDLKGVSTPFSEDHEEEFGIPTLEDLGLDVSSLGPDLFPGGEQALRRLDEHMQRTAWVCKFEKPQTSPNSLRVRQMSYTLLEPQFKILHSEPPVSLHGQLLWREFFYTTAVGIPNFNRMEGNPHCVQVDWDNNPEHLAAWREARTGFPFIDAIMTQLRQEGWIHHLARHAVACFLTRGDLWISWEEGQKVFEELLLDADWSLNAGNWQWLSASAFFHQYFRVYSPIAFGKKTDKYGDYIKKYLPVLRKFPAEYIYEPWKAPLNIQERAGCIVGKDYPRPIVEHEVVHKNNIQRMKAKINTTIICICIFCKKKIKKNCLFPQYACVFILTHI